MRRVRDNWFGLLLVAVIIGLALSWHSSHQVDVAQRENVKAQTEFNLRTCTKGVELRDQANRTARTVNSLKAELFTITKAAADGSGDPEVARARYGALADQIRALPDIDELPPTDCAAIVKLYSPTP